MEQKDINRVIEEYIMPVLPGRDVVKRESLFYLLCTQSESGYQSGRSICVITDNNGPSQSIPPLNGIDPIIKKSLILVGFE